MKRGKYQEVYNLKKSIKNISQEDLAKILGTSQSYIAKLEGGDANPTIGKIGRILARIGLRISTNYTPLESKIEEKGVWVSSVGSNEVSLTWMPLGSGVSIIRESGELPLLAAGNISMNGIINFECGAVVVSTAVGSLTEHDIDSRILFQAPPSYEKGKLIVSGGKE